VPYVELMASMLLGPHKLKEG